MSKLLKNVIIGVASGAAAAYFLSTEKGKEFQKKAAKAYEAYKENPAEYHQKAKDKATEYTDLAVDTFNDYRQKFESGELTTDEFLDTVKEKGKSAADFASEKVSGFTSKVSEAVNEAEEIKTLDASNAYRFGFQAIQSLVNKADVEDNRIRFF